MTDPTTYAARALAARLRLAHGHPPETQGNRAARRELLRIQAEREAEQAAQRDLPMDAFKQRRCRKCDGRMTGPRARFDSDAELCFTCEPERP